MKKRTLWLIVMLFLCGCSKSGLDLAPLSGKVTYRGESLTHGKVVLTPHGETKGPPGVGVIQADGTYSVVTARQSGAIVGAHKVTVICRKAPTEEEKQSLAAPPLLIPEQYTNAATTPLTITVKPESNTFDIDLE